MPCPLPQAVFEDQLRPKNNQGRNNFNIYAAEITLLERPKTPEALVLRRPERSRRSDDAQVVPKNLVGDVLLGVNIPGQTRDVTETIKTNEQ